jgi:hypothetical protein
MNALVLYGVCTVAASTAVSGALGILWSKSRSAAYFVLSMAAVWVVVSALPLSERFWETASFPPDPTHFLATMFWAAPFVIAAVIALVWPVRAGASRNIIFIASLVASLVALPFSFLSGIYATCSLGDCL